MGGTCYFPNNIFNLFWSDADLWEKGKSCPKALPLLHGMRLQSHIAKVAQCYFFSIFHLNMEQTCLLIKDPSNQCILVNDGIVLTER